MVKVAPRFFGQMCERISSNGLWLTLGAYCSHGANTLLFLVLFLILPSQYHDHCSMLKKLTSHLA